MFFTRQRRLSQAVFAMLAGTALTLSASAFADDKHDNDNDDDDKNERKVYIMHSGDLHGDTESHPNARADATGRLEGGLARAATVIKKLKKKHKGKIIWGHTGDTIQGSAVATYTQGKALVDVWDALAPDVFAAGNWEFVYGLYRYQQLFGSDGDIRPITEAEYGQMFMKPYDPSGNIYQGFNPEHAIKADQNGEKRRWRSISANAYYNGLNVGPGVNGKTAGEHFTDPYYIKEVNGIKIGFIGCTTNRGPQVVSSNVTAGLSFSNCMGGVKFPQNKAIGWADDHPNRNAAKEKSVQNPLGKEMPQWGSTVGFHTVPEIIKFTEILRADKGIDTQYINSATGTPWQGEGVDLVVVMSEAGIPENLWNAEHATMPEGVRFPEIILSSDTHERTRYPVVATNIDGNKTVIIEEGEDGMQVGLLELEFEGGELKEWEWKRYDIDDSIRPDSEIADLVKDARAPFVSVAGGGDWVPGDEFLNPFNGYTLTVPIDYQMASTEVVLERNRFSYEHDPANLKMPADIEGTLHDVYADAFRALTDADVGEIRGFRYNNTIMPGPITVKDVYHSLTIGAMIARGNIPASPEAEAAAGTCISDKTDPNYKNHTKNDCHFLGWPRSLVQTLELSGNGTQQARIPGWSGGWFFNYSGVNFDLDVFKPNFDKYGSKLRSRTSNVRLVDAETGLDKGGNLPSHIDIAAYYFDGDFNRINRNQIVSKLTCKKAGYPGVTRACADEKMLILVKVGKAYGAQMAWVNSTQFSQRETASIDGYDIFPLDVVEAFGRYVNEADINILDLRSGTAETVTVSGLGGAVTVANLSPTFPRINLLEQLPDGRDEFGFSVIQPMRGATLTPANRVDAPDDEGDF
ncbi:hypothetical protein [sulfur-oxidizing endosymbiont of Gigantopelta aegis]|uniref:hypothetical protein n=1 Tax=sulfur-oxidizing endosymbiont of Gigantopelta aegis TaxID=2794934 RepID=UPI0018DB10E8|nr:hypothetical protein [sulfur-oxidizing endosymbiont of Gigantopelta aegis]